MPPPDRKFEPPALVAEKGWEVMGYVAAGVCGAVLSCGSCCVWWYALLALAGGGAQV